MAINTKQLRLTKAGRLAFLALLIEYNQLNKVQHKFDTAGLAKLLGTTQRSIQRDLHDAWRVYEIFTGYRHSPHEIESK